MKKTLLLSFCVAANLSAVANNPSPLVSPQMKKSQSSQNKMIQKAIMNQAIKKNAQKQGGSQGMMNTSSDVMIVEPTKVASDWKQAFMMLKQRSVPNLTFALADGSKISNIDNIDSLPGGYLIMITLRSLHGISYKIIKTSEIMSLSSQ